MIDVGKYGPWAVIPGGSEGMGACMAHKLGKAGINLVLIARKREPLEDVAKEVRAHSGVQVRTLALDLTGADILDRIREVTDDLDVGLLVYNAGAAHRTGAFLEGSLEDALKIIRLNALGQTTLSYHFGKKMAARGRGGIVIIGSMAGNAGSPSVITYAGAKAFSQIFAEGLWWELKQHGVDVLHMVVGPTATPAMARLGITYHPGEAADADDVAQLSLDNIANGPVFVMPELVDAFRYYATPNRREATETNARYVLGNTTEAKPVAADASK
jgi:uncharacterized protein